MKHPLILALLLVLGAPCAGAEPNAKPNRYAATIIPAERFETGTLLVERHGTRGTPLILIPGLASGSWVWENTVRRFRDQHQIYVVTLPGFDGRPAVAGDSLLAAQQALKELIVARKLDKPVLIGHSLGATLSIGFAEQDSDLIGGVVAIDGLPVFPGTENLEPAVRMQMAAGMKENMAAIPAAQFGAQQQAYMRGIGVLDMARADELAKLSAKSDPSAVVDAMAAVVALDLRAGLPRISVPVLLLSPFFELDAAQLKLTEAAKTDYYKSLMAGTPKLQVVSIAPARHFAMFDQPQQVGDAIERFLSKR